MDPAFQELRPWDEGRLLGAKRALKPDVYSDFFMSQLLARRLLKAGKLSLKPDEKQTIRRGG